MKLFRLLPATITVAIFMLCVKVVQMVSDTESLFIGSVVAKQEEPASKVSEDKPATVADQGKTAKKEDAKKDDAKKTDEKSSDKKPAAEAGEHGKEEKKEKENPAVSKELDTTTDHRYTSVEVDILQNLSKRREELNVWESNIQIKEAALDATQKRIDDKIAQIEAMKKQIAELLEKYNTQEDAKIKSLVKIYENMKPAEAARIFDEIEMPILLLVIDAMSEKKAAPILASMNPKKAKQLTVELANERRLNQPKIAAVTPTVTPPTPTPTPNPAAPPPVAAPEPASIPTTTPTKESSTPPTTPATEAVKPEAEKAKAPEATAKPSK